MKRIGIISDTHGQVEYTRPAIRLLESLEAELVIHCGDIGSAEIVPLFSAWPTHFVFGNVDDNEARLRQEIQACGQTCHERFGSLTLDGIRIAFLHGDDWQLLERTISSGQWDLVCHGHTHRRREDRCRGTLIVNPGAIYRANPHSFAVIDLPGLEVTSVAL